MDLDDPAGPSFDWSRDRADEDVPGEPGASSSDRKRSRSRHRAKENADLALTKNETGRFNHELGWPTGSDRRYSCRRRDRNR
jgi:hypothetical protein